MADNYLEYHRQEYEQRKERWLSKQKHINKPVRKLTIPKPEDEAL